AIGGITVIIGALLAFVQDDVKKVLAYSTVSQLGYMVMALGTGAWTAGVFHLFTHAFFKALLFLGSGSLIHAVHSNNMSEMGGLRKHMPTTCWTFILGSLALAVPAALAGLLNAPFIGVFHKWVEFDVPGAPEILHEHAFNFPLAAISLAAAGAGILIAYRAYAHNAWPRGAMAKTPALAAPYR